jgi:hypothetical protein
LIELVKILKRKLYKDNDFYVLKMVIDKWLSSEEDIRKWIKENKRDPNCLMASREKSFIQLRILNSGFPRKQYYKAKNWFLSKVSSNYRDAEGYEEYESWRKSILSNSLS